MIRAACFTLLLAFALPAAADDKFVGAMRDAVVKKIEEREAAKENASDKKDLPVTANVGRRFSSDGESSLYWSEPGSLSVATCPMGAAGAPTFDEVRTYFRNYTDNEMWKICVNRNSYLGAVSGSCACALLAYPDPWRPVDVPHALEREEAPPAEDADVAIETVPEETAEND